MEELERLKAENKESGYAWELMDKAMKKVIGRVHVLCMFSVQFIGR